MGHTYSDTAPAQAPAPAPAPTPAVPGFTDEQAALLQRMAASPFLVPRPDLPPTMTEEVAREISDALLQSHVQLSQAMRLLDSAGGDDFHQRLMEARNHLGWCGHGWDRKFEEVFHKHPRGSVWTAAGKNGANLPVRCTVDEDACRQIKRPEDSEAVEPEGRGAL